MAMFDSNIDYTKFIQFTEGSLRIATDVEIRDALVQRYKEIYGNDIDTSTASADGEFINSIALIIRNMCETFAFSFKQLNPSEATGKYLDVLCSYNNVYRRQRTNSKVQLYIKNISENDISNITQLSFNDRNNQLWIWNNDDEIIFKAGKTTIITNVTCEIPGPVQAIGSHTDPNWNVECPGDIYQTVETIAGLKVWQKEDAIVGRADETDEALRSRRFQMMGNQSVSILSGLEGALLDIAGIKDAIVINNPSSSAKVLQPPINDGTSVDAHSIYIALRYEDDIDIDSSIIGRLIYNKLTPGIDTTQANSSGESYNYIEPNTNLTYTIYWKKCESIKPDIVLTFNYNQFYDYDFSNVTGHLAESDVEKNIVKNLVNYIKTVKIDEYLQTAKLLNVIQQSDIPKQGSATLFASDGDIGGTTPITLNYPANLNYFKYNENDFYFSYNTLTKKGTIKTAPDIIFDKNAYTVNVGDEITIYISILGVENPVDRIQVSSVGDEVNVDQEGSWINSYTYSTTVYGNTEGDTQIAVQYNDGELTANVDIRVI